MESLTSYSILLAKFSENLASRQGAALGNIFEALAKILVGVGIGGYVEQSPISGSFLNDEGGLAVYSQGNGA